MYIYIYIHAYIKRSDGQASAFGRDDQGSFKFEAAETEPTPMSTPNRTLQSLCEESA